MKISLCGQYWYKYNSFVNIEDSLLCIHENIQALHVLNVMELCRMWSIMEKSLCEIDPLKPVFI